MKNQALRLLLGLTGLALSASVSSRLYALDGTEAFMDDPLPKPVAAPVKPEATLPPIQPITPDPEVKLAQVPASKPVKPKTWAVAPEEGDTAPVSKTAGTPYPYNPLKDGNTPPDIASTTPTPPPVHAEIERPVYPGGAALAAIIKDEEDARRTNAPLDPDLLSKRYKAVIDGDPDNPEAHYRYGVSLMKQLQYKDGIKELEKAVVLKPGMGRYLCGLGRASLQVNDIPRAVEACSQAVQSDPGNPFYRNALGNAYLKAGGPENIKLAAVSYGEAVQLEPKNAHYLHNLARALSVGGAAERAIEVLNEVINTDPESASAYNDRGALYEKMGENAKAISDYKTSTRLDPDFIQAHVNLALFYANEKTPTVFNKQATLDHAEIAVRLTSRNNALCLMTLAEAYRANRRMDDAIKTAKDAIAILPTQEYLDRLALYERMKTQPLGSDKGSDKSTSIRVRQ